MTIPPEKTGGVDDVTWPVQGPRATVVDALVRVVRLLESRLENFDGHSDQVAELSTAIAQELDLPPDQVEDIRVAGLLHDIGMLATPDEYLTRPGKLERSELEKIRAHPQIGADLVRRFPFLERSASYILFHHERLDGTGYPKGLSGAQIPLGARIVGIAEVYSSLVEFRGHRRTMTPPEAIETLAGVEGFWFDRRTILALTGALNHDAVRKQFA